MGNLQARTWLEVEGPLCRPPARKSGGRRSGTFCCPQARCPSTLYTWPQDPLPKTTPGWWETSSWQRKRKTICWALRALGPIIGQNWVPHCSFSPHSCDSKQSHKAAKRQRGSLTCSQSWSIFRCHFHTNSYIYTNFLNYIRKKLSDDDKESYTFYE